MKIKDKKWNRTQIRNYSFTLETSFIHLHIKKNVGILYDSIRLSVIPTSPNPKSTIIKIIKKLEKEVIKDEN